MAQIPQSNNLLEISKILIYEVGFQGTYSFKSVLLKKDLIALGYVAHNDATIVAIINQLVAENTKNKQAQAQMNTRYNKYKNLLTEKSQGIFYRQISNDPYSFIVEKRISTLEKIGDKLKNNKNDLVATFIKLTLESYYFRPDRKDIRKFIRASK